MKYSPGKVQPRAASPACVRHRTKPLRSLWAWFSTRPPIFLMFNARTDAGVAVEEAVGEEGEAVPLSRQNRPVLGAGEVMEAHRVPQHDVAVIDWAVLRGIGWEAVAAPALVRVCTGGVELAWVVGGDPERRGREGGALLDDIVGREERSRRMAGAQLVAGMLAERIGQVRVHHAPDFGRAMFRQERAFFSDGLLNDRPQAGPAAFALQRPRRKFLPHQRIAWPFDIDI